MSQETVVLIPGLLCDGFVWEPLVAEIDGQVHIADWSTQVTIQEMATDTLSAVGGKLILIGHSLGGRIAMEMARQAPDRISRMVLMNTGMHPLREGEIQSRRAVVRLAYEEGMQALVDQWLPPMVYQLTTELMGCLEAMVLNKTAELHERQINALVSRPDASLYLPSVQCPVLLLVGEYDRWSSVVQHEAMLEVLPNAQLTVIAEAGHFALVEKPLAVVTAVLNFLVVR